MNVLVTAGARGIGRATALAFAARGDRVHVCDIDGEALEAFSDAHPDIGVSQTNVADPGSVAALFDTLREEFGTLQVLVNNAGIAGPTAPVEEIDFDGWKATLAVNCDGAFLCTRAAVPIFKSAGAGSIVNISSTAGIFGFPLRTPYAAAKWAIVGMTKTWAMELGEFGIRVNAICPGSVAGPRMDQVIASLAETTEQHPDSVRDNFTRQTSMRSFIDAEDIAQTILFLCSAQGRMISGQILSVDGHTETLR